MKVLVLASVITCASATAKTCTAGVGEKGTTGKDTTCLNADEYVSTTASCAAATCATTDRTACCLKKDACTVATGYGIFGSTKTLKCDKNYIVSTTAKCESTGQACAAADKTKCCLLRATCDSKFEESTGTSAASIKCAATHKAQSTTVYCKGTTCTKADDEGTCCLAKMKCAATKGFEMSTGVDVNKINCATAERVVHTTMHCADTTCSSTTDDSTCCVPLCKDVFTLGTAGAGEIKCKKTDGMEISDGHCKGSVCASATDDATCCVKKTTTTSSGNNSSNKSSNAQGRFAVTSLVSTVVGGVVMMLS